MYNALTVVAAGMGIIFMVVIAVLFGWKATKKGRKGKKVLEKSGFILEEKGKVRPYLTTPELEAISKKEAEKGIGMAELKFKKPKKKRRRK